MSPPLLPPEDEELPVEDEELSLLEDELSPLDEELDEELDELLDEELDELLDEELLDDEDELSPPPQEANADTDIMPASIRLNTFSSLPFIIYSPLKV